MSETTSTTMTRSEIKAAQQALKAAAAETRKAETKKAVTVAKAVLRAFPEDHTFGTGSVGRSVRQNIEVDGRKAFLNVTLVFSDTVVKAEKETPKVSLVKTPASA